MNEVDSIRLEEFRQLSFKSVAPFSWGVNTYYLRFIPPAPLNRGPSGCSTGVKHSCFCLTGMWSYCFALRSRYDTPFSSLCLLLIADT